MDFSNLVGGTRSIPGIMWEMASPPHYTSGTGIHSSVLNWLLCGPSYEAALTTALVCPLACSYSNLSWWAYARDQRIKYQLVKNRNGYTEIIFQGPVRYRVGHRDPISSCVIFTSAPDQLLFIIWMSTLRPVFRSNDSQLTQSFWYICEYSLTRIL